MKSDLKEGLSMGFLVWLLTLVLGIPLGFLQMGYIPRYLVQLILVIVLLVRSCKKPTVEHWLSLLTLEGLVLLTAVLHIVRGNMITVVSCVNGFEGLAMVLSGIFGLFSMLILGVVTLCLFLRHKD